MFKNNISIGPIHNQALILFFHIDRCKGSRICLSNCRITLATNGGKSDRVRNAFSIIPIYTAWFIHMPAITM